MVKHGEIRPGDILSLGGTPVEVREALPGGYVSSVSVVGRTRMTRQVKTGCYSDLPVTEEHLARFGFVRTDGTDDKTSFEQRTKDGRTVKLDLVRSGIQTDCRKRLFELHLSLDHGGGYASVCREGREFSVFSFRDVQRMLELVEAKLRLKVLVQK